MKNETKNLIVLIIVSIIIMIIPVKSKSQSLEFMPNHKHYTFKMRENKTSLIFNFISGMSDGLRDASLFGRTKWSSWSDGTTSWKNKYENGDATQGPAFFGSTTFAVMFTDMPHAANTLTHLSDAYSKVYMPNMAGTTFWQKTKVVVIYVACKAIGHNLIYGAIFKPK